MSAGITSAAQMRSLLRGTASARPRCTRPASAGPSRSCRGPSVPCGRWPRLSKLRMPNWTMPTTALIAPMVMMTSTTVSAAPAAEQPVGDRDDGRRAASCLQSMRLVRGSTEKKDGDERRAGVGRQRPEHPRHLDPLAPGDEERRPTGAPVRVRRMPAATIDNCSDAANASSEYVGRALEPRARRRPTRLAVRVTADHRRAVRQRRAPPPQGRLRPQRSQTSEIAGRADPLIARTARQPRDLHRFGREARIAPGRRAHGSVGP